MELFGLFFCLTYKKEGDVRRRISRFHAVIVLCLIIVLCSSEAFAYGGYHGGHYYRGGRWYRHGWFGFDVAVSALTIGALVDSLPPRYTTVVVGGVPYYYYDNLYYRSCRGGYVVVPAPVITQPIVVATEVSQPVVVSTPAPVVQSRPQISETVTINIPNSRGGYTAIALKKYGNGFIGPQGEYYSENPTVEQLKTLYGK